MQIRVYVSLCTRSWSWSWSWSREAVRPRSTVQTVVAAAWWTDVSPIVGGEWKIVPDCFAKVFGFPVTARNAPSWPTDSDILVLP